MAEGQGSKEGESTFDDMLQTKQDEIILESLKVSMNGFFLII